MRVEYGGVPDGIDLAEAPDRPLAHLLRRTVDAGEAEVIALGTALDAAHVVLDDAAARAEARDLDVTVIGTVGPVVRAEQAGYISAVLPLLDARQGSAGSGCRTPCTSTPSVGLEKGSG